MFRSDFLVARKQEFDKRNGILWKFQGFFNIFNENITKLVIDVACEKL